MPISEIPNAERVVADHLREVTDRRVVARAPDAETGGTDEPWIRLCLLGARDTSDAEHLIEFMVQIDCYAGSDGGMPEATAAAREVRAAMKEMRETDLDGVVVSEVRFTGHARIADPDLNHRDRVVLTANVWMHNTPLSS